ELMQHELLNWFGSHADQLQVAARGNLQYNLAILAKSKMGVAVCLDLDCSYEGLRFVPLEPKLTSGTVLVWKKAQTLSPATLNLIQYIKKYIKNISDHSI